MKLLSYCWLLLFPFLLQAQSEKAREVLPFLNAQIDHFTQQQNQDSLLYYYQQRIDYYRTQDNMAEYVYGYCYDLYYDVCGTASDCILPYLQQAETNLWRAPLSREDSLGVLILYRDMGLHFLNLGQNVPKAKEVLEKAKAILENSRFRDTLSYNIVYKSLGNAYTILGDNERAIRHFQEAIDNPIFTADQQAGNYLNLAISYWNKNEIETSNRTIEKALLLKDLGKQQKGRLFAQLATNYLEWNQYPQALEYGHRASTFFGEKDQEENATLQYIFANVYLEKGLLDQAEKNIVEGLKWRAEKTGRKTGKFYICYSQILERQGKWEKALVAANRALTCVLPDFKPADLLALPAKANLYSENTILEALEVKAQILQKSYLQNHQNDYLVAASDCYDLAFEVEQLLRQNYLYESSKLDLLTYSRQRGESAIELAFQRHTLASDTSLFKTAFQYAENSKSIVLLDAIKRNDFLSKILEQDSLVQRERDLLRQKRFFEIRVKNKGTTAMPIDVGEDRKVALELEKLQTALLEKYPALRQSLREEGGIPQDMLNEKNALLEFFYGEKNVYLFLVEKGDGHFFKIGKTQEIDSLIARFRSFFSDKNKIDNEPKAYQKTAYQLYQLLFPESIRTQVAHKEEWILILDGSLNFVPFEALVTSTKESFDLGNVDYLIQNHRIRYAYSAKVLEQQNHRHSKNKGILAMAPVFERGERGQIPLLYSKEELTVFHQPFLGKQATLKAFQEQVLNSQLIHLSTHAKVEEQGQARIEFIDSTLFLDELYTLNLDADLVVLSACETGIGTLQKGEGLMSLGRGFAYAGAASLIVSLWSVQDASTAWLMTDFYRNIKNGQSKSEALHQAKLHYLSQTHYKKSPYYWSVLSYIGADQTLDIDTGGFSVLWIGLGIFLAICLMVFCYFRGLR